ncbi:MAG TPA: putative baseplate assembly protein [Pyrinomonadaceae bacterium]|nr:putative baseplate assembly protein [Pyrinomonadaceae bacterium]
MIAKQAPPMDERGADVIFAEFRQRLPGHVPNWMPPNNSAGAALGQIFARFVVAILRRLNQAPARKKLAFLDLLGLRLVPAQAARAPIVFSLSEGAANTSAPARTQVAAPPPPGSSQQIVFETEQEIGVAAARLAQVVSLWPGRDQYIDHTEEVRQNQPVTLFEALKLKPTVHGIYLAHKTLLNFAGATELQVQFDLEQGSSAPLQTVWEYWDGKVWRGFKTFKPSCLEAAEKGHDGTNGLTRSGSVHLLTDCAQTALTEVNGVKSYWIRARLDQTLPPDPQLLLPVAAGVQVRTQIDQSLGWLLDSLTVVDDTKTDSELTVVVINKQGSVMPGVPITFTYDDPSLGAPVTKSTGNTLDACVFTYEAAGLAFSLTFQLEGVRAVFRGVSPDPARAVAVLITPRAVKGLLPYKAISDGKTLDLTKEFFPLGQSPVPGSAMYFKLDEIFSKPDANVEIHIEGLPKPSVVPIVNWEYWNGERWVALGLPPVTNDFTDTKLIKFPVPKDMVSVEVNNEDGLWVRVRLVNGSYGNSQSIKLPDGSNPKTLDFTVPTQPVVSSFTLGYSWLRGPEYFEEVFTFNDFHYEDHTDDARWPGMTFSPYQQIAETTAALYLGFDKQLPVNNFGLYLNVVDDELDAHPQLIWEYFNGSGWRELVVNDETQQLRFPGIISFIPEDDSVASPRFDQPLHWLRGRLKEDGPPSSPTLVEIESNAVWASQQQTFVNTPLGTSTGMTNQMFQFSQVPILPGQQIEVQELSGARANTEWRIIALQIAPDDPKIVVELEARLAEEGTQTDFMYGDGRLRLVRDKTKKVIQVWVRWEERSNLFDSGRNDRHYVLDHASGLLLFGDGEAGMVPPPGAAISAASFRTGGGLAGNVPAKSITQLLGSVSGIQSITNVRAGEGGANGETLEQFAGRAPLSIHHRGRAVTLQDYETMAHEASASIAFARATPMQDQAGVPRAGWIKLIVIPLSSEARPQPSAGLRDEVFRYLETRAPADVAIAQRLFVAGPDYFPLDVTATIAAKNLREAGTVEQQARAALATFLHPLRGGPEGAGWDLGRGVYVSGLARVLGEVVGVDYVKDLSLSVGGQLQGDQVNVPIGKIVVEGEITLNLI